MWKLICDKVSPLGHFLSVIGLWNSVRSLFIPKIYIVKERLCIYLRTFQRLLLLFLSSFNTQDIYLRTCQRLLPLLFLLIFLLLLFLYTRYIVKERLCIVYQRLNGRFSNCDVAGILPQLRYCGSKCESYGKNYPINNESYGTVKPEKHCFHIRCTEVGWYQVCQKIKPFELSLFYFPGFLFL